MVETLERPVLAGEGLDALVEETEERTIRHANTPITFSTYLDFNDGSRLLELVQGVLMEKAMVQLDHEKLFSWLYRVLGDYVEIRGLGIVFGSRSAVRINDFGARLPDIFFVRDQHMDMVKEKATVGPPDLVVELLSPNDRPSDIIALESDYRSIGVREVVFIDQRKKRVRILRKREVGYDEAELPADGEWRSDVVEGFAIDVSWMLSEPRPRVRQTVDALLGAPRTE